VHQQCTLSAELLLHAPSMLLDDGRANAVPMAPNLPLILVVCAEGSFVCGGCWYVNADQSSLLEELPWAHDGRCPAKVPAHACLQQRAVQG